MGMQLQPRTETRQQLMLHIFPSFSFGGQQARLVLLAQALDDYQHHIVSLDGDLAARSLFGSEDNVEFSDYEAKKSSIASLSNISHFRKLFAAVNPDVLCTYNWGAMEAVMANRLGPRLPHIHFEDGFSGDERPDGQSGKRIAARRILLGGSNVVVPSKLLEGVAEKVWKLKPTRIHRITNGIDFDKLQAPPSEVCARISVGTVGALRPEKNHDRLIRTFLTADMDCRAQLTIVGEGPCRDSLISAIKDYQAEDSVMLAGATATPEEAYRNFDIFALSSDTEQAPLTLMEAMAAGLPIVAPNVGDIVDMVSEGNRAYITPPGDEEAFTYALAQLIQNPTERAQLGAANRAKARDDFALDKMINAHRALYQEVAVARG